MLLIGCTKIVAPADVSKNKTSEINVTTNTVNVTKETIETTQNTTVVPTPEIIFSSLGNNQGIIYICNSDGIGEVKNLTNNSAGNYEACYSPDGSMIVYRSNKGLADNMSYDIFVMPADGSNQINITANLNNTSEFNPSW